jgi:hypothetical protein
MERPCTRTREQMGFDIETARITALPDEAFYISDFINEGEESRLLQKVWIQVFFRFFTAGRH